MGVVARVLLVCVCGSFGITPGLRAVGGLV